MMGAFFLACATCARSSFIIMRTYPDTERSALAARFSSFSNITSSIRTEISLIGLAVLTECRPSFVQSGLPDLLSFGLKVRISIASRFFASSISISTQDKSGLAHPATILANPSWLYQRPLRLVEIPTYVNTLSDQTAYSPAPGGIPVFLVSFTFGDSQSKAYADSAVSGCSIYFFAFLTGVSTTFLTPKSCDSNPFSLRNLITASRTTYEEFRSSISAHFAIASLTSSSTRAKIVSFIAPILADIVCLVNMARLLLTALDIPVIIYLTPNSPTKRNKHSAGPSHQQQVRLLNG